MYVMTACISRASRAKTEGLPNCDHEILLAKAVCEEANNKVWDLFDELAYGRSIMFIVVHASGLG